MKENFIKYLYECLEKLKIRFMNYILNSNSDVMYDDFMFRINKSEYNLYMWINNKYFDLYI